MVSTAAPQLDKILEEMSLDECCSTIHDPSVSAPNKIAMIATLAAKFSKNENLTTEQADAVLSSLPNDMVEELLCEGDIQVEGYQRLLYSILVTLLSTCSEVIFETYYDNVLKLYKKSIGMQLTIDSIESLLSLLKPCKSDSKYYTAQMYMMKIMGSFMKANTTDLPSLQLLASSSHVLGEINPSNPSTSSDMSPYWLQDYRVVLSRLLRSPPQRVSDDYRRAAFQIIDEMCRIYGSAWFEPEPKLLCLLAHLVSGQLRITLEKPDDVDILSLVTCISLAEMCIRSVDEEEFLDDDDALIISKAVRELSSFVMDYWGDAMETEEKLSADVQRILYRYVCVFLAIGGAQMIPADLVKKVALHMQSVCRNGIDTKAVELSTHLIASLDQLCSLQDTTPQLLTDYIGLVVTECDAMRKEELIEQVLDVLEVLIKRSDWYSQFSIKKAIKWAKNFGDKRLIRMFESV